MKVLNERQSKILESLETVSYTHFGELRNQKVHQRK